MPQYAYPRTHQGPLDNPRDLEVWLSRYLGRQVLSLTRAGVQTVSDLGFRLEMPYDCDIESGGITLGTGPTGQAFILDLHKDGTTIYTDQDGRPTIAATEHSSGWCRPDNTTWRAGSYLTAHVDQVGSGDAGSDLTVTILVNRRA